MCMLASTNSELGVLQTINMSMWTTTVTTEGTIVDEIFTYLMLNETLWTHKEIV